MLRPSQSGGEKMMSRRSILMLVLLALSVAAPAHAEELTGEQIAKKMLPTGVFENDVAGQTKLKMVLVDKDGKETERAVDVLTRRKDGLVQSVVRFRSPP